MASIRMVREDEAVGRVKAIYQEIKQQFGIDFVPNLYRVMAPNPPQHPHLPGAFAKPSAARSGRLEPDEQPRSSAGREVEAPCDAECARRSPSRSPK